MESMDRDKGSEVHPDDAVSAARRNRELMPLTAAIVDEYRKWFGPVKVRWAREGDIEVGKRGPEGVPVSAQFNAKEGNDAGR